MRSETANFNLDKVRTDGLASYNFDVDDVDEDGWDLSGVQTHESEEGEVTYFFGDGTDDDLWDELFGTKKKKKTQGTRRAVARGDKSVTKIAFVSDMHGRYVTGLRKIRKVDPNAIVYQKVPKVLPLSWAKIIKPYAPPDAIHTQTNWRPGMFVQLIDTLDLRSSSRPNYRENHMLGNSAILHEGNPEGERLQDIWLCRRS